MVGTATVVVNLELGGRGAAIKDNRGPIVQRMIILPSEDMIGAGGLGRLMAGIRGSDSVIELVMFLI